MRRSFRQRAALVLRRWPRLHRAAGQVLHGFGRQAAPAAGVDVDGSSHEEQLLRERLLSGTATLNEGNRLYSLMIGRGEEFPLAWEEVVLGLGLEEEPHRPDLNARLRYVLVAQGKTVPPDVERAFAEYAAEEERARDHQRDAAEYHIKTGTADMEPEFLPIYERCRAYSMTSLERMYALYSAVRYIENAGIEGDIVECGVWRGGSMMVVAHTLAELGGGDRGLYLFDTFEGLPRPDKDKDVDVWGNRAIDGWLPRSVSEEGSHWAEAGLEEVRENLLSTGYPAQRMHFVKGMVEQTLPGAAPNRIALLRLDTDWYASTKHELEHLFDRLALHGVLILDDYGHFKGARAAVDEFLRDRQIAILLHRVDYAGRVGIKIAG